MSQTIEQALVPSTPGKLTKNLTSVLVILDESSSMGPVQRHTIDGFNEYLNGLRKDGNSYVISLTKFNHNSMPQYTDRPLPEVENLNTKSYIPCGTTALYDAICDAISAAGDVAEKVLCVILTDGQENSSKENGKAATLKLIEEKQSSGKWTFIFLGAAESAWNEASAIGIPINNVASFTNDNVQPVMSNLSARTSAYAGGTRCSTSNFYGETDQAAAALGEEIYRSVNTKRPDEGSSGGT